MTGGPSHLEGFCSRRTHLSVYYLGIYSSHNSLLPADQSKGRERNNKSKLNENENSTQPGGCDRIPIATRFLKNE
jgi:hypothetical protein